MGVSTISTAYGVALACVFLSSTASLARATLSNAPLFDDVCIGLTDNDDAEVRVFVTPGSDLGSDYGVDVEICQAKKWILKVLKGTGGDDDGKVPTSLTGVAQQNHPRPDFGRRGKFPQPEDNSPGACEDPNIVRATLSNTIPDSDRLCDITEAYLSIFDLASNDEMARICFPPPWYCHISGKKRRLLDSESSIATGASIASMVSSGSSISIEADEFSGSGASTVSIGLPKPRGPSDQFTQIRRKAAITVCKGECCVTTVVTGSMYWRLLEFVPKETCPGFFKTSGPGGSTTISTTATSSGQGVGSSASSSSSTSSSSTLVPGYVNPGIGSLP
ncbi:hypothetical protein BSKO_10407 [Bryopsis sp. KO-2023]|nr:hypothetical protein BSKO_10407 [Bryopsis sp. KO-2023]